MDPDASDSGVFRSAKAHVTDPMLVALLDATVSKSLRPSEVMALLREHLERIRPRGGDDEKAARAIALADAAHGAEGIAVIDPYTRELARWVAEGRMTGNEAVAFIAVMIDAGAHLVEPDGLPDLGYQAATVLPSINRPGALAGGDVQKSAPSARPAEYPQSDPGFEADLTTAAPSNPGGALVFSASSANSLSDRVGPLHDTAGLRDRFQISSEAVDAQVRSGELLAVVTADGFRVFPAFQIDEGGKPLPRLREVLAELDPEEDDPWGDAVWLNAPSDDLEGLTPAAALRAERADDVIRLARQAGAFRFG